MRIHTSHARSLIVCLVVVVLSTCSGCATMSQAEIKALETREMHISYDEAYQAAMNGLFSLGFSIEHTDKASGVVTGRRHDPRTGSKIAAAVFFGVLGLAATSDKTESVTFKVAELEPELTQLRMKVIVNGKPVVDRKLMTKIWQRIEREALLESGPSDHTPSSDHLSYHHSGYKRMRLMIHSESDSFIRSTPPDSETIAGYFEYAGA